MLVWKIWDGGEKKARVEEISGVTCSVRSRPASREPNEIFISRCFCLGNWIKVLGPSVLSPEQREKSPPSVLK